MENIKNTHSGNLKAHVYCVGLPVCMFWGGWGGEGWGGKEGSKGRIY